MRSLATTTALGFPLLALACGSPTAPSSPTPAPTPLTASFTATPGGQAIMAVTVMTFKGTASGGNGPLTYSWDFGDGTSATGATATHIFNTESAFAVVLKVTDGTTSVTTQKGIIARSIAGEWFSPINPKAYDFIFDQQGTNIIGHEGIRGTLSNPRNITFHTFAGDYVFTGVVEKGLDGMEVSYPSPDGLVSLRLCRETC
jgi:hypothetical protein